MANLSMHLRGQLAIGPQVDERLVSRQSVYGSFASAGFALVQNPNELRISYDALYTCLDAQETEGARTMQDDSTTPYGSWS